MAWFALIVSGVFEAVWALALSASHGFRRWKPALLFVIAAVLSMAGLAWAMTRLPTGTAYAVWVGIGATITVVWSYLIGAERPTVLRVLLLVVLVGSVVGLKAVS